MFFCENVSVEKTTKTNKQHVQIRTPFWLVSKTVIANVAQTRAWENLQRQFDLLHVRERFKFVHVMFLFSEKSCLNLKKWILPSRNVQITGRTQNTADTDCPRQITSSNRFAETKQRYDVINKLNSNKSYGRQSPQVSIVGASRSPRRHTLRWWPECST